MRPVFIKVKAGDDGVDHAFRHAALSVEEVSAREAVLSLWVSRLRGGLHKLLESPGLAHFGGDENDAQALLAPSGRPTEELKDMVNQAVEDVAVGISGDFPDVVDMTDRLQDRPYWNSQERLTRERLARLIAESRHRRLQIDAGRDGLMAGFLNANTDAGRQAWRHEMERVYGATGQAVLLMADLDRFKMVNDAYGHQAGDIALAHFAAICSGKLRPASRGDTHRLRLGGEEVGFFLEGAGIEDGVRIAERIRMDLEQHPAHVLQSLTRQENGQPAPWQVVHTTAISHERYEELLTRNGILDENRFDEGRRADATTVQDPRGGRLNVAMRLLRIPVTATFGVARYERVQDPQQSWQLVKELADQEMTRGKTDCRNRVYSGGQMYDPPQGELLI